MSTLFYHIRFNIFSDLTDEFQIGYIGNFEIRKSALTYAVHFARSANFQINFRQFKSVARFLHRTQTIGFVSRSRKKITIALICSSSDSSAELMELRETKTFRSSYTHDSRIGNIDPDFYDGSGREDLNFVFLEFFHDIFFLGGFHLSV